MNYKESAELLIKIKEANGILINCHHMPDADSVGGAMALAGAVEDGFGKRAKIICPSPIPKNLQFLGTERIEVVDFSGFDYSEYDVFFLLDTSSWSRATGQRGMDKWEIPMALIDHHDSGEGFADVNLIDREAPANCQVLVKVFQDWSVSIERVSKYLLTGIIGDTGAFRFPEADVETFEIASTLMKNAKKDEIVFNLFQSYEASHLEVWQKIMEELVVESEAGFVYSFVNGRDFGGEIPLGAKSEIADMIFQSVDGTDFGFVGVMERGYMSVSFRSRTGTDVAKLAETLGGGGHRWASAARIEGKSFEEATEIVLHKAREYVEGNSGN